MGRTAVSIGNNNDNGKKGVRKDVLFSGMLFRRNGGLYLISTPKCKPVARFQMPEDGQYVQDSIALIEICKILSVRWAVQSGEIRNEMGCGGLVYRQINMSEYEIYIPYNGGIKVAEVITPTDGRYDVDARVLGGICKALVRRYNI